MKRIAIIFFTIVLGLLVHSQLTYAQEIHKWIDEKGTIHFTDNPGTIKASVQPDDVATRKADELARQKILKRATPNLKVPQRSYYDAHPGEYGFELAHKEYLKIKSQELEQKMREIQREVQEKAAFQKKLDSIQRAQQAQQAQQAPSRLIGTPSGAIDPQTGLCYPSVPGGIVNPRTGEFMPDVGAVYFDPKTGRFIPK